jgi:hypothetical protein
MSTTGRELVRGLRLLLALGVTTTLVLLFAYRGVHEDTVPLASSSAPGVLAVDTAHHALRAAHRAIRDGGPRGDLSSEFHTQVSVAHQSLAVAASKNVLGVAGRHDLQTVTGLISVYSHWVERWGKEEHGALGAAYLHYAEQVLGSRPVPAGGDVMSRLAALRQGQLDEAERQAAFTRPLRLGWGAVAVLYCALLLVLLRTQRFHRRRFRRTVQPQLLVATALCALGVPALGWITLSAQRATAAALEEIRVPAGRPDGVPLAADRVQDLLARADRWQSLSDGVLFAGGAVVALAVWALWPRIAEYRWTGPR